MSQTAWNTLHQAAMMLESRLEMKVQKYTSLAQKINADFLCDEENPLMESKEEQELAVGIDEELNELAECISQMRNCHSEPESGGHQEENLIRRYHEIYFGYCSVFKSTSSTVSRKRETKKLFENSRNLYGGDKDSDTEKLLGERTAIDASRRSMDNVLSQAIGVRNAVRGQRETLTNVRGGISGIAANVPSFTRFFDGIQNRRSRESMILAVITGTLIFFTIWWLFLR